MEVKNYDFKDFELLKIDEKRPGSNGFEQVEIQKEEVSQSTIKEERENARLQGFKFSTIVSEYRGLDEQQVREIENEISRRVEVKLKEVKDEAFEAGYSDGYDLGFKDAKTRADADIEKQAEFFRNFVDTVSSYKENLFRSQREEIFRLVNSFTKWILLKEVSDPEYVKRLLEKLILEAHSRSDLLIRVNRSLFNDFPSFLEELEGKIGELSNTRIEIEPGMEANGLIVESKSGILDGSLEAQMKNLDKLFEKMGVEIGDISEGFHVEVPMDRETLLGNLNEEETEDDPSTQDETDDDGEE